MKAANRFKEIARGITFGLGFLVVILLPPCVSTAAISEWDKTFGGSDLDHGNGMALASDGGYVIVGTTESYGAGEGDIWLIKTDSSGAKQWDRTFGGSRDEKGASVERTSDGGYIIAGSTWSYGSGAYDFWLIKTDANGNKQWDRTFGGLEYDNASSVQQTSDGGYIIAGHTWSYGAGAYDVWLIKTDAGGNQLWDRAFGGPADDYAREVQQTSDGGYIITGSTESYGAGMKDVWLVKTDAGGAEMWSRTFGGAEDDNGNSVRQTSDGGYIITGTFDPFQTEYEFQKMWLIKTDGGGIKQWEKIYGDRYDVGESVRQTSDGGYIIAGCTYDRTDLYATIVDAWVIKTNSEGIILWDQRFGGADNDYGACVRQTGEGEYVFAGYTESKGEGQTDVWLVKVLAVDPTTIAEWDRVYGRYGDADGFSAHQTNDGGYALFGNLFYGMAWLIKTDHNGTRLWDKKFAPIDANYSGYAFDGQQTSDGGYIILGKISLGGAPPYFAWLIKTDALGQKEWEATYGGGPYDACASVQQTSDGGYILTGAKTIKGGMWLIKTDAVGTVQWERVFFPQSYASGSCVRQTSDGGYIITGSDGGHDALLIKTDQNGIEQWIRRFDRSNVDKGCSVWQTADGGYIVAGETDVSYVTSISDIWLIKTDGNGLEEWNRTFGGTRSERASAVYQTPDGGYAVAGSTMSFGEWEWDAWVIRTDENGNELWNKIFGGAEDDFACDVQPTSDGAHIVAGTTYSFNPEGAPDHHGNAWLIKTSDSPCTRYYRDSDGDGYGVASDYRCFENPIYPYTATITGDCNDSNPAVNPGATEVLCNGWNDDCNPSTPDDPNADSDPVTFCAGDCDDDDPAVYPGALEICGDGIDNDCDLLVDSEDPDCLDLTGISCLSPPNESVLDSSPTFVWTANGGADSRFAIDLSYDWTFSWYWSTYENLRQPIAAESWAMPQPVWDYIPSGSYVYWRVRGADLAVTPLTIITSDEVWWFYKQ